MFLYFYKNQILLSEEVSENNKQSCFELTGTIASGMATNTNCICTKLDCKKSNKTLSKDLHTEVRINHVSLSLFNSMNLEGTLIKDQNKDTLLYADKVKVRITDWFFLKDELVLKYVGLEDAYVNMYRKDSIWNYQFLVDYFSPTKPKDKKKKSNLKFNLKKLDFKNIAFIKDDGWIGT